MMMRAKLTFLNKLISRIDLGRNPRSGESVAIPEKRVPHFKPGKALREAVDARTQELLTGSAPKG